ncbi:MAG: hypothetical protein HKM23_04145 [Nitrosopumilus sp.]|nr:hypothetical protein [Nitrosopumilus sp.]
MKIRSNCAIQGMIIGGILLSAMPSNELFFKPLHKQLMVLQQKECN